MRNLIMGLTLCTLGLVGASKDAAGYSKATCAPPQTSGYPYICCEGSPQWYNASLWVSNVNYSSCSKAGPGAKPSPNCTASSTVFGTGTPGTGITICDGPPSSCCQFE